MTTLCGYLQSIGSIPIADKILVASAEVPVSKETPGG